MKDQKDKTEQTTEVLPYVTDKAAEFMIHTTEEDEHLGESKPCKYELTGLCDLCKKYSWSQEIVDHFIKTLGIQIDKDKTRLPIDIPGDVLGIPVYDLLVDLVYGFLLGDDVDKVCMHDNESRLKFGGPVSVPYMSNNESREGVQIEPDFTREQYDKLWELSEYQKKELGVEVPLETLVAAATEMGIDCYWQAYKHMSEEDRKEFIEELKSML